MKKERRKFERSFKLKAVELSYSRENIKGLAEELGIDVSLLYRWRREFPAGKKKNTGDNINSVRTTMEEENKRLKKELKQMRLERDILKKAVSIFSKSDGTSTDL